tara:strand:- start:473 stop:724 length:252 start_codon:yes stop_codon:yes gene_type:complete
VLGVKLVRLLVKVPGSVPSLVLLPDMVGPVLVPQTTPLSVRLAPPSLLMTPPLLAVVKVIEETEVVLLNVGTTAVVVKLTSAP